MANRWPQQLAVFNCSTAGVVLASLLLSAFASNAADAQLVIQSGETVLREAVAVDVDSSIERRFETVRQHIAAEQWDDAVRFLVEIRESERDGLIKVEPDRYVSVDRHVAAVVSSFPEAALRVWQDRVDGQARQLFDSAVATQDPGRMRKVNTQTPFSRYHNRALLQLGDMHWQLGNAADAAAAWSRLLMQIRRSDLTEQDEDAAENIRTQPAMMARLAMCDVAMGMVQSAAKRATAIETRFPTAKGTIAGQSGLLFELVNQQIAGWSPASSQSDDGSFSGDIRCVVWNQPFRPLPPLRRPDKIIHPAISQQTPTVFPLVWNDKLLMNDPQSIYALNFTSGEPAWSTDGVISKTSVVLPRFPLVGDPTFEMSVDRAGRLFARMGSPVTIRAERELTPLHTELVCLDLANGQGKELWRTPDSQPGSNFAFEGTPVCDGDRLYSVATFADGTTEMFVVCLNATTGTELWRQRACTLLRGKDAGNNEVSSATVSVGDRLVVLATNQGAIAGFDKLTGKRNWVVTYPSSVSGPCVQPNVATIRSHRIYVAPSDSDRILSLDASNGQQIWATRIPDSPKYVLGVVGQRLIVSGRSIWGIDTQSGAIVWGSPRFDPGFFGHGRGLIDSKCVYWPRRGAIEFRNITDGRHLRPPLNLRTMGLSAGNLVLSKQRLLISGSSGFSLLGTSPLGKQDAAPPATELMWR